MSHVALLLGGNQGDRLGLLHQATFLIAQRIGKVAFYSRVYETEPWGDFGAEQPQPFLNQALVVETPLSAHQVLRQALSIEAALGRRRSGQSPTYASRPIDIDLIFYDSLSISTPELTLPHPRAHLRRFVLEPLAEIMPHYRHPLLGRTVEELLADLINNENIKNS